MSIFPQFFYLILHRVFTATAWLTPWPLHTRAEMGADVSPDPLEALTFKFNHYEPRTRTGGRPHHGQHHLHDQESSHHRRGGKVLGCINLLFVQTHYAAENTTFKAFGQKMLFRPGGT